MQRRGFLKSVGVVTALAKPRVKRGLGLIAFMMSGIIAVTASGPETGHSFGNPDVWRWAPSRTYHVENYKLTLRFDEPKGEVFGDEVVTLRPFEPHFREFFFESSELKIDSVTLELAQGTPVKLTYTARRSTPVDYPRSRLRCDQHAEGAHRVPRLSAYRAVFRKSRRRIIQTGRRRSIRKVKLSSIIIGFRAGTIRTTWRQARRSRRFPTDKPWFRTASW